MHSPSPCFRLFGCSGLAALALAVCTGVTHSKPVEAFIYLEPFELRLEVLTPANLLTPPSNSLIDDSIREQLLSRWQAEVSAAVEMSADGQPVAFEVTQMEFVRSDDKRVTPDERNPIPIEEALVGTLLVSSREAFPGEIELTWKGFSPLAMAGLSVRLEAGGGGSGADSARFQKSWELSDSGGTLTWSVPADLEAPSLVSTEVTTSNWLMTALAGAFVLLIGLGLLFALRGTQFRAGIGAISVLLMVVGALVLFIANYDRIKARAASRESGGDTLVESLLGNVYHAFDFRQESLIYDTLATSVDGPILEELYLDIRRSLEIEEQGGPRARVERILLGNCEIQNKAGRLEADATWTAFGSVGHWGHLHQRRNQYEARLTIEPRDGRWKIVDIELLQENRT